jgi:hypothetical protein
MIAMPPMTAHIPRVEQLSGLSCPYVQPTHVARLAAVRRDVRQHLSRRPRRRPGHRCTDRYPQPGEPRGPVHPRRRRSSQSSASRHHPPTARHRARPAGCRVGTRRRGDHRIWSRWTASAPTWQRCWTRARPRSLTGRRPSQHRRIDGAAGPRPGADSAGPRTVSLAANASHANRRPHAERASPVTEVAAPSPTADELRARLADTLIADAAITTPAVAAAVRTVPREAFVPGGVDLATAYADDVVKTTWDQTAGPSARSRRRGCKVA